MNASGTQDSVRCAVLLSGGVHPFIRSSVPPHIGVPFCFLAAFIRSSVPPFQRIWVCRSAFWRRSSVRPFHRSSAYRCAVLLSGSVQPFIRSTVHPLKRRPRSPAAVPAAPGRSTEGAASYDRGRAPQGSQVACRVPLAALAAYRAGVLESSWLLQ